MFRTASRLMTFAQLSRTHQHSKLSLSPFSANRQLRWISNSTDPIKEYKSLYNKYSSEMERPYHFNFCYTHLEMYGKTLIVQWDALCGRYFNSSPEGQYTEKVIPLFDGIAFQNILFDEEYDMKLLANPPFEKITYENIISLMIYNANLYGKLALSAYVKDDLMYQLVYTQYGRRFPPRVFADMIYPYRSKLPLYEKITFVPLDRNYLWPLLSPEKIGSLYSFLENLKRSITKEILLKDHPDYNKKKHINPTITKSGSDEKYTTIQINRPVRHYIATKLLTFLFESTLRHRHMVNKTSELMLNPDVKNAIILLGKKHAKPVIDILINKKNAKVIETVEKPEYSGPGHDKLLVGLARTLE